MFQVSKHYRVETVQKYIEKHDDCLVVKDPDDLRIIRVYRENSEFTFKVMGENKLLCTARRDDLK